MRTGQRDSPPLDFFSHYPPKELTTLMRRLMESTGAKPQVHAAKFDLIVVRLCPVAQ
jgi:hypothetical protein